MDVSSFLKWETSTEGDRETAEKPSALSVVHDNISNFLSQAADDSSDSLATSISRKSTDLASITSEKEKDPKMPQTILGFRNKQQAQLTDILVEKLLSMALPPTTEIDANIIEGRVETGKSRPGLSVQIMSKNFIQLNSRLSVPFELVDNVIRFFSWERPSLTLTVLMIYTHTVLKPLTMLTSLPFFFIIIYIMAPAYTLEHQPEQHTVLGRNNPVLAEGPNLKYVETPKPASEFSKEFILNLTDLQNHMTLYVMTWDAIVEVLNKFAYYKDEAISPFFFVTFLATGTSLLLFGEIILQALPLRLILITLGWGLTIAFHPYFHDYVFNLVYSEDTRYFILGKTNRMEEVIHRNFEYEEPQEQKEVEIFEIQQFNNTAKEWNLVFYLDNDFTEVSDARVLYDEYRAIGTTAKSAIMPPKDWTFVESDDWKIDLSPEVWIKSHLIDGVVRVDHESKWVYDLGKSSKNYQPQFRRRRWTRTVTRSSEIGRSSKGNDPKASSADYTSL